MANQTALMQFFHGGPGFHVISVDVRPGILAARGNIAARRMKIWKRPMDEIEVEIIEPQIGERLLAGGDHVLRGVLVVPELGGNPQLLPLDARGHHFSQRAADLSFIAVNGGAVEVPVTNARGGLYGLGNLGRGNMIGAEGAKADSRHPRACVISSMRDRGWIDSLVSLPGPRILCMHSFLLATVEPHRNAARRPLFRYANQW